jgi:hypothetical protein
MTEQQKMKMNDNQLILNGAPYAPTTITFMLDNAEEVIKLSKEGFYYKGKLIEEDHEIYLRFKEWLDQAHAKIPKPELLKLNSIEERDSLIQLMREALKFYADQRNYNGPMGNIAPIDSDEHGSQARFALAKVKELIDQNQKIQDDYDKLIMETENYDVNGETNPIDLIRVFTETHVEEDNLTKMRRQGNENPIV